MPENKKIVQSFQAHFPHDKVENQQTMQKPSSKDVEETPEQ